MDLDVIVRIGREALLLLLVLSAPPVLAALVIGLLVSILQAATQIQEQTLTFVPKLFGIALVLAVAGYWILQTLLRFAVTLFDGIPQWVR